MSAAPVTPGTLYLVPVPLSEGTWRDVLPAGAVERAAGLDYFVVERARTARRWLAQWPLTRPLQSIELAELNEHTAPERIEALLAPVLAGRDAGLMSEAGCPGVADPGAPLVAAAHRHGVRVVPLAGPSAILMTLMASGLGGQRFAFHGYLPVEREARADALRALERRATGGETQLWIETPYRAQAMLEAVLATCADSTRLAMGCDLTSGQERTAMRPIEQWRRAPPRIEGALVVFAMACEAPGRPAPRASAPRGAAPRASAPRAPRSRAQAPRSDQPVPSAQSRQRRLRG